MNKGIPLIVLVITITSTYDEANKIDMKPPASKTNLSKNDIYIQVIEGNSATCFFFKILYNTNSNL